MQTRIYADHAATTPLSPAAYEAMQPWLLEEYGNPSTLYYLAREPRKAIASARQTIADCIGAKPNEIYFTSGGTEADNWALTGVAFRHTNHCGRIITSCIEHHAILKTCEFLQRMGYDIDLLPVNNKGVVSASMLRDNLHNDVLLVSLMLANNEIGTIQPIQELANAAHQHGCIFHTDAVQAVGHIPVDVNRLSVDMLSASAHKFNGPKGVGFLYMREGLSVESLIHGGAQENNMRAGTENVAGIVGMAVALQEHYERMEQEASYLHTLTDCLLRLLHERELDFILNGSSIRIPGTINLSFRDSSGELLLHRLDLMGTAVATGSACDSKNSIISHVIKAIGVPGPYADGTIRISLGMENTTEQMQIIADQIKKVLNT